MTMPEHYPKSTVEVSVWCDPCRKVTMHRVDHGRRGPCLECMKKRELEAAARPAPAPPAAEQMKFAAQAGEVLAVEAGAENMPAPAGSRQGKLFEGVKP